MPRRPPQPRTGVVRRSGGFADTRGFTLMEVMVTLIIIGVMAVAAIPAFLGADRRTDLETAQYELEGLFRAARDSAVRAATEVHVTIDSASSRFWIEARQPVTASVPSNEPWTAPSGGLGSRSALSGQTTGSNAGGTPGGVVLDLPSTVRLEVSQSRASFVFLPSGAAMGDSILLRDATGQIRSMMLDPWNGRPVVR